MPIAFRLPLLALVLTTTAVTAAMAQEPATVDLFAPDRPTRSALPSDPAAFGLMPGAVGAVEAFNLNLEAANGLRSGGPDRQRLRIALPGGETVTCDVTRGAAVNGVDVMQGTVSGSEDRCALFVGDGTVSGDVSIGADRYRVVPVTGGAHAVVEINTRGMSEGERDAPIPPGLAPRGERSLRDEPLCDVAGAGDRGTIDILILYTPRAAARQDMTLLAAESMDQLNRAAAMGPGDRFGVTFRLVGLEQVRYREGADLSVDLDNLSGVDPNILQPVTALRDRYAADLVHLVVEGQGDDGSCGIGWLVQPPDAATTAATGFSVSDHRCSVANMSFAHEIGHNLGMNHDRHVVRNADPNAINFGYVSVENQRRTLMAYGNACYEQGVDCPRVLTFSTPDKAVAGDRSWGVALDSANPAYNREILCRNAPEVAAYR